MATTDSLDASWLALMIGNSRLHWAWFSGRLKRAWDTPHLEPPAIAQLTQQMDLTAIKAAIPDQAMQCSLANVPKHLPLWVASVVPAHVPLWQAYHQCQVIDLDQIPIAGLYSTLGIDRALALLGASDAYGLPNLVIDAGTALTFSGIDAQNRFVGGAILPGLQLQFRSLADQTAALPLLCRLSELPQRWATDTIEAMGSGVVYSLIASLRDFITAWQQRFPTSAIVLTGGDGAWLAQCLYQLEPELAAQITVDPQIIFGGIQKVRELQLSRTEQSSIE